MTLLALYFRPFLSSGELIEIFLQGFVAEEFISSGVDGRASCSICGKGFIQKSDAKRHILAKHSGIEQQVECEFCGKTFKNKDSLGSHARIAHNAYKTLLWYKPKSKPCFYHLLALLIPLGLARALSHRYSPPLAQNPIQSDTFQLTLTDRYKCYREKILYRLWLGKGAGKKPGKVWSFARPPSDPPPWFGLFTKQIDP